MIDVTKFGAAGDGSTDDTTAIQAAINAAQNIGAAVHFPPATYLVASFLSISDKVTLQGERQNAVGRSSYIRFTGDGGGAWDKGVNGLVRITSGGVRLSGLTLESANAAAGTCLLNFSRPTGEVSGIYVEDCDLLGGGSNSTNTLMWGYAVDTIRIRNTVFQYAKQMLTFGPHTVASLAIDGCVFSEGSDGTQYMLDLNLGGNSFGLSVTNNVFECYLSQLAARISANNGLSFRNNYVGDGVGSDNQSLPSVSLGGNGPVTAEANYIAGSKWMLGVHSALGGARLFGNSVIGSSLITGRARLGQNSIAGSVFLNCADIQDEGNSFRGSGHSYQRYSNAASTVTGYVAGMDTTTLKIDPNVDWTAAT
ncbi:MAG TPA: glycosyl hydrolase family 28-related protein [Terriglobales bacterium]|nr:glycosyl hydrolase family 28-related protein [Terriglobales bacterium]